MRRSKSLLNNLASSGRHAPEHAHAPWSQSPPPMQASPAPGYPPSYEYPQANPAYTPYPPAMQPANAPAYPSHPVAAPGAVNAGYPAIYPNPFQASANANAVEIQQTRQAIDALASRLGAITAAQESQKNRASAQEDLKSQLGNLTRSFSELQANIREKGTPSGASDNNIDTVLDGIRQDIVSRLGEISDAQAQFGSIATETSEIKNLIANLQAELSGSHSAGQIDPAAYAQAVEASHSDVLNEVRNIQAAVERGKFDSTELSGILDGYHGDLVSRLDALASQETGVVKLDILSGQMDRLENLVVEGGLSGEDLSKINERLEETTRAILALSASDNTIDNLERIEARLIDISKEVGAINREESGSAQLDNTAFEPVLSELRNLSERVSNISAVTGDGGSTGVDNSALIARLDELVERVGHADASASDDGRILDRFDRLDETLRGIAMQLADLGNASVAGQGSHELDSAVVDKLDGLAEKLDSLGKSREEAYSEATLASLDRQIGEIAAQLSGQSLDSAQLDPVVQRLEGIEQQLGASRDIGIELAAGAAEEAVRRAMESGSIASAGLDPAIISQLSEDLRRLGENPISQEQAGAGSFGELHTALDQIATRLAQLEIGLNTDQAGAYQMAAPAFAEPAIAEPTIVAQEAAPQHIEPQFDPQSNEPNHGAGEQVHHHPEDAQFEAPQESFSPEGLTAEIPLQEAEAAPSHHAVEASLDAGIGFEPEPQATHDYHEQEEHQAETQPEGAEREMTAGEKLVRAARMAEQERQRAKKGYEEEYSDMTRVSDERELDAELSRSVPEESIAEAPPLPTIEPPQMASPELPDMAPATNTMVLKDLIDQEDIALEPGSSGPDLAALVRQANDRRKALSERGEGTSGTDFLAAARRAAQAAAVEASEIEKETEENKSSGSMLSSITGMLSRRKKVLTITAAAALLVAIAIPLVSQFPNVKDQLIGNEEIAGLQSEAVPISNQVAYDEEFVTEAETDRTLEVTEFEEEAFVDDNLLPEVDEGEPVEVDNEAVGSIVEAIDPVVSESQLSFVPEALKEAAMLNNPKALYELARLYSEGIGTEKNMQEAARLYEEAASLGVVPAQYIIGNFNEKGIGVTADRTIAQAWYEQAASNGHIVAMHNLGVMHATPDKTTGKKDFAEAFEWFKKAADRGVRDSQVNLGIFLAKGTSGTVDLAESYKWFAVAARSGDKDAAEKRDFIADAMRPDQLEDAKKRVENWRKLETIASANDVEVPESWKVATNTSTLTDVAQIAKAQTLLSKVGFDAGPADGVIGEKTRRAIIAFRTRSGLPVKDTIDAELLEALHAVAI